MREEGLESDVSGEVIVLFSKWMRAAQTSSVEAVKNEIRTTCFSQLP